MAGLAQILFDLGHNVKGSDSSNYVFTEEKLKEKGIEIESLDNMNYKDSDIIIIGNSFIGTYDFINKKTISYQEALSYLNDKYYSIAVCGTHGKTTTTNMIKHVLSSNYDTSYLVGDGQGKAYPNGNFFVYEACEHRKHFLSYNPDIIVCTNIDYDHVDYYKNKEEYKKAFFDFFSQKKKIIILDSSIKYKENNVFSFGINKGNTKAKNIKYTKDGICFDLLYKNMLFENIFLPFFGKHMLYNALACITCCGELNIPILKIINELKTYKNAERRYNVLYIKDNIIIDDYGHHPTEINATIKAIKQEFKNKKLIIVFHPDRPKRLLEFLNKYTLAFNCANKTYVLPFLSMNDEKKQALNKIINKRNICLFNDSFFLKKYNNYVFLFTGSKDMSSIIKQLIESIEKT